LPLAIELAAARIRILSPAALRALLDERLRLLTGGAVDTPARHQTLEATLAWSYDLLEPHTQATFRALATCAGGCTFETVAAITAAEDVIAVLDDIETLVDQSLLRTGDGPDGNLRYAMLETVRDYARARLADDPETDAIRDRHATYFVEMAEQGNDELSGPDQTTWQRRLDADLDNMREALAWFVARENQVDLLRLASALWSYWHRRGLLRESSEWLERAVGLSDSASPESRAAALVYLANAAINLNDHARAARHYQASKDLWTALGNRPGIASCLVGLGLIATSEGDFEQAHELYAEALDIGQEAMSRQQTLAVLSGLGQLEVARGDLPAAASHLDRARLICEDLGDTTSATYLDLERTQVERLRNNTTQAWQLANNCLAYFRGIGESRATGFALVELGYLETTGEHVRLAAGHFREAQTILGMIDDHLGLVRCLEGLVHLAVQVGKWHDAAVLAGGAGTWRIATGSTSPVPEQASLDLQLSIARQHLGAEAVEAALVDGSKRPFDQVGHVASGLLDFIEGELGPREMISLPAS
jgi:tetratricopeptide (TPR) repeat protein